jgi:hypothetical protein
MGNKSQMPTRAEIDDRWVGVAEGRVGREETHDWAEPLMFADGPSDDVMVMSALQYLHGFDMTYRSADRNEIGHGPPGTYMRSLEEIREELDRWRVKCVDYDADPEGWVSRARAAARKWISEDGGAS